MSIEKSPFGTTADGTAADLYTLTNASGGVCKITNYGGITTDRMCRTRVARMPMWCSALKAGGLRGEDRISAASPTATATGSPRAKFTLDGMNTRLATNNNENHRTAARSASTRKSGRRRRSRRKMPLASVHYTSPDGEEGYPGELNRGHRHLLNDNALRTDAMRDHPDKPTVVNLTHHSYFNLAGAGSGTALDHELQIVHLDSITRRPMPAGIPTGGFLPVKGTPFDFNNPPASASVIESDHEQIKFGLGYDHNWVLQNQSGDLVLAATLIDPQSSRTMEVLTTEPGIQFYTGNYLDGSPDRKGRQGS
ncbi:MAG: galactose-1-epimerase [Verrucomicrobiales bacterium]